MGTGPGGIGCDAPFHVHADLRIVRVGGGDARRWLHDIVTSDVASLGTGEARVGLLLGPTGRIRAAFATMVEGDDVLLAQSTDQPSVADHLRPYVLSADVRLTTVEDAVLVSVPVAVAPAPSWRPSLLPSGAGATALVPVADLASLRARAIEAGCDEVTVADVERERVLAGIARFPVDLDAESLPAEAAWDVARIDRTKGCFVGQETVAKVANAGHPTRVVLAATILGGAAPGDPVLAGEATVGVVTSAVGDATGLTAALVRVRWDARATTLRTASGAAVSPR